MNVLKSMFFRSENQPGFACMIRPRSSGSLGRKQPPSTLKPSLATRTAHVECISSAVDSSVCRKRGLYNSMYSWLFVPMFLQNMHICLSIYQYFNISIYQYINISTYQYINISIYHYIDISIYQYINIPIYQYINISIYQYINISIYQYINISIYQYINKSIYQYIDKLKYQYTNISIYQD